MATTLYHAPLYAYHKGRLERVSRSALANPERFRHHEKKVKKYDDAHIL